MGSQTSSSRSAGGGGRGLVASSIRGTKNNFHDFITVLFCFFFLTTGYFPTWKQYQVCGFIHLFLHNRCVVFFNSPVPSLHSPLTCAVEQQSAAACTLCNLRYQRWACLFVWRKRWANSAGYVLTVQCCLSALTLLRVRWLQAPRVCTSLRRRAVSQVMQEG